MHETVDETTKPTIELLGVLEDLKTELEYVNDIRNERDKVIEAYKTKLLPNLLKLRRLNRTSKDKLEIKYDQTRQMNQKLLELSNHCDNLSFEASCLNQEISKDKNKLSPRKQANSDGTIAMESEELFDPDRVDSLSYDERTKMLEQEGIRRKDLCDKLKHLVSETDDIEQLSYASEQQLNRIKPYIKQLIDKVGACDTTNMKQDKETS